MEEILEFILIMSGQAKVQEKIKIQDITNWKHYKPIFIIELLMR